MWWNLRIMTWHGFIDDPFGVPWWLGLQRTAYHTKLWESWSNSPGFHLCCPLSIRSDDQVQRHEKQINDLKPSNWNQEPKYSSNLVWCAKTSFGMPSLGMRQHYIILGFFLNFVLSLHWLSNQMDCTKYLAWKEFVFDQWEFSMGVLTSKLHVRFFYPTTIVGFCVQYPTRIVDEYPVFLGGIVTCYPPRQPKRAALKRSSSNWLSYAVVPCGSSKTNKETSHF